MSGDWSGYVAALDVGTTTVRCQVINKLAKPIGSSYSSVKLHYPRPGYVEIHPDELWNDVVDVIKKAILNANITVGEISSLGISTQRATFITWRKDTGKPLHNFITWKDLRAVELIKQTNSAWKTSVLRFVAYAVYLLTRNKKFGMISRLQFASSHVTVRLLWVLQNIETVKEAFAENNLLFGTLETWLVYKFTNGKTYVSDISNASATGLYDPFSMDWSLIGKLLDIPQQILPPVVNNDYDFGMTSEDILGKPLKIGCVMADQSASMFGSCRFDSDDLKVTLGTGAFLNVNTSKEVHTSLSGMYPLVGWKTSKDLVYISEVPCADAGSIVEWMLTSGLIDDPSTSSDIATNAESTAEVYFIPAFSGLGPPINNENAATGFIGITPTTTLSHMVRAVLESIVYRIALTYEMLLEERVRNYKSIRIDGGVAKNNFICQLLADLTNLDVERLSNEMAVKGVAFLAGLGCGIWLDMNDLRKFDQVDTVFNPSKDEKYKQKCKYRLNQWKNAAKRFESWYDS